jgi:hypothetical protein
MYINIHIYVYKYTSEINFNYFLNSYEEIPRRKYEFDISRNFTDNHNWHAIKLFSHFFMGIFFTIMTFILTFHYWEVKDYTDANEVNRWYVYVYSMTYIFVCLYLYKDMYRYVYV